MHAAMSNNASTARLHDFILRSCVARRRDVNLTTYDIILAAVCHDFLLLLVGPIT